MTKETHSVFTLSKDKCSSIDATFKISNDNGELLSISAINHDNYNYRTYSIDLHGKESCSEFLEQMTYLLDRIKEAQSLINNVD